MGNFTKPEKVQTAQTLFLNAKSIRQVAAIVGIARNTAEGIRRRMPNYRNILCACGKPALHRGWCAVRFQQSPKRQEFMQSKGWYGATPPWVRKLAKTHPSVPDISEFYPYSREDVLIRLVSDAMPDWIQNDTKADVSQDLLLALVSGEIKSDELHKHVPIYLLRHRRRFGQKRFMLSLDSETPDGRSLHELVAHVESGGFGESLMTGINYRAQSKRYERIGDV